MFTKNGYSIQLKFETSNSETLELAKLKIFTRLPHGNERIRITCSKINCHQDGILVAYVNSVAAKKLGECFSYAPNVQNENNDFECLSQQFEFNLTTKEYSSFNIECKLEQPLVIIDSINFDLQRLR